MDRLAGYRRSRGHRVRGRRVRDRRALALAGRGLHQGRDHAVRQPDLRPARAPGRRARRLLHPHARHRGRGRHLGGRPAVPLAVRHGHRHRVHRGHRPAGGHPGAGPGRRTREPSRHPRADRPAVGHGIRHRAVHDLLRPDGQVLRDRDDVRHDRHLPADPGLPRRPVAVVGGIRGRRRADRPVQPVRAADPGRARRDAAADRRSRPGRAGTPDRPDTAALASRLGGRGDRARPAARRRAPRAEADRLGDPARLPDDREARVRLRGLTCPGAPVRPARAGRYRGRLPRGQLAPAQPRGDSAAVAGRAAVPADRRVVHQAGLRRAVRRVLPARAGHPGRRGPGRAGQARQLPRVGGSASRA